MKSIKFIWVGKLKEPFWREAAAYYWKRLGRFQRLNEVVIKDGPARLGPVERSRVEGEMTLKALKPTDAPVCLDEKGEGLDSMGWAELLRSMLEDPRLSPCFIIGGPFGLSAEVLSVCGRRVSLGPMTMPHDLARIVLLEQVYRGLNILGNTPYHHV